MTHANQGLKQDQIAMDLLNLPQPGCHPERSEGSAQAKVQILLFRPGLILRYYQDDTRLMFNNLSVFC